jgi:protein-disulfide isomerase
MKYVEVFLLGLVGLGCARTTGPSPVAVPRRECPCKAKAAGTPSNPARESPPAALDHAQAAVPVTAADPTWGNGEAPVTMVVWSDFECPFCSRAAATVEALQRAYGPETLRVVWKNLPSPSHPRARPTAEVAMAVFALGGSRAFWTFHDLAFASQGALSDENLAAWAAAAGLDPAAVTAEIAAVRQRHKLDEDRVLAARLGVRGTPTFHINGIPLEGARAEAEFRAAIDGQLPVAGELIATGTPARGVYPALCARNLAAAAPPAPRPAMPPLDSTIWPVPVERDDPVRGAEDALVTLVLFGDFACPFCQRLEVTLAALRRKYGADLRIVWKDLPPPFHPQALPAAVLARLAAAKHGPDGFWRAHDALVQPGKVLDEATLKGLATRLGVPWFEVAAAIEERRFQPAFDRTAALAKQLGLRGTPSSFVNGRRIDGALPPEVFAAVIEAQLAKARDLLETGQTRGSIYATLTKTPLPEAPFERKTVTPPTRDNPARGSVRAKVTVQIFGDFQCPETLRVVPKLAEIEKQFAGRVRLVWRNHPLVFHEDAALAAEAAQEVFAQKGASGFWRYHELLFAAQTEGGLGRAQLEKLARRVGVDGRRFRAALSSHRHRPTVARDIEAAEQAQLAEVPAVLVNDLVITGVEPVDVFERAVAQALAESTP